MEIETTESEHVVVESEHVTAATAKLREKIRIYSQARRGDRRAKASDSLRFGLGEIQKKIESLEKIKDATVIVKNIKGRRKATEEEMYRLSHAFLQDIENIEVFAKSPGAIQVIVKELIGDHINRKISAAEFFCNLSLGDESVCEKIALFAGSFFVTYLDSAQQILKRTAIWVIANILSTGGKGALILIQMELVPKLWHLYTAAFTKNDDENLQEDAAICLQQIALQSKQLLREQDKNFLLANFHIKDYESPGSEYHLQILFHSEIIHPCIRLTNDHLTYLVHFALSNSINVNANDLAENATKRQRVFYAIRILANLIACEGGEEIARDLMPQQLSTLWNMSINQYFQSFLLTKNMILIREVLWLLKNFMSLYPDGENSVEILLADFL